MKFGGCDADLKSWFVALEGDDEFGCRRLNDAALQLCSCILDFLPTILRECADEADILFKRLESLLRTVVLQYSTKEVCMEYGKSEELLEERSDTLAAILSTLLDVLIGRAQLGVLSQREVAALATEFASLCCFDLRRFKQENWREHYVDVYLQSDKFSTKKCPIQFLTSVAGSTRRIGFAKGRQKPQCDAELLKWICFVWRVGEGDIQGEMANAILRAADMTNFYGWLSEKAALIGIDSTIFGSTPNPKSDFLEKVVFSRDPAFHAACELIIDDELHNATLFQTISGDGEMESQPPQPVHHDDANETCIVDGVVSAAVDLPVPNSMVPGDEEEKRTADDPTLSDMDGSTANDFRLALTCSSPTECAAASDGQSTSGSPLLEKEEAKATSLSPESPFTESVHMRSKAENIGDVTTAKDAEEDCNAALAMLCTEAQRERQVKCITSANLGDREENSANGNEDTGSGELVEAAHAEVLSLVLPRGLEQLEIDVNGKVVSEPVSVIDVQSDNQGCIGSSAEQSTEKFDSYARTLSENDGNSEQHQCSPLQNTAEVNERSPVSVSGTKNGVTVRKSGRKRLSRCEQSNQDGIQEKEVRATRKKQRRPRIIPCEEVVGLKGEKQLADSNAYEGGLSNSRSSSAAYDRRVTPPLKSRLRMRPTPSLKALEAHDISKKTAKSTTKRKVRTKEETSTSTAKKKSTSKKARTRP